MSERGAQRDERFANKCSRAPRKQTIGPIMIVAK